MLRCPRGSPFTGERRTSAPVQLWPNLGLDVCSCCRCCLLPAPADADTETAAAAPRRNNAPDASAKVPSRKGSTSVRRTVIKTFVVDCTPPLLSAHHQPKKKTSPAAAESTHTHQHGQKKKNAAKSPALVGSLTNRWRDNAKHGRIPPCGSVGKHRNAETQAAGVARAQTPSDVRQRDGKTIPMRSCGRTMATIDHFAQRIVLITGTACYLYTFAVEVSLCFFYKPLSLPSANIQEGKFRQRPDNNTHENKQEPVCAVVGQATP